MKINEKDLREEVEEAQKHAGPGAPFGTTPECACFVETEVGFVEIEVGCEEIFCGGFF
jgi:hypothetical protein